MGSVDQIFDRQLSCHPTNSIKSLTGKFIGNPPRYIILH